MSCRITSEILRAAGSVEHLVVRMKTPRRHVSSASTGHCGDWVVGAFPARQQCREYVPVRPAQYIRLMSALQIRTPASSRPFLRNSNGTGKEQLEESAH
jgi:hypothetical protein